jgi:hypothetical protein
MKKYKVKCFIEECNDDVAKSIKYEDTERFATFDTIDEAKIYVEKQREEVICNNTNAQFVIRKYGENCVKIIHSDDYSENYTFKIERVFKPVSIIDKLKYYIIENNGKLSNDELECNLDKLILVTRGKGYNDANQDWLNAFENGSLEDYAKSFTE